MSLGRKATIGAGWMIAWRGVARLLGLFNTLILARLLAPADFGLVAMAMTFEVVLQQIAAFPVYDALLRRPENDTDLHDAAFTIQLGRSVLTAAILAACAPFAAVWFGEPRLTALVLALSMVTVVNGFSNIGMVEFSRELRFDVQFKLQLLPTVLQIVTTLGVAWLTRSYWALLAGLAVSRISRTAMTYIIHPYRPRLSLHGWRQLLGFSFWLWLSTLAGLFCNDYDPFAVGRMFGAVGLGVYTLAVQVAKLPTTELVQPLSGVLFASFAYAQRDGSTEQVNPLRVALALLLPLAPIALVISAGAADFVSVLLGAKWSAATPLVAIGVWCAIFYPVHYVCGAALIARGQTRSNFLVTVASAVLRVGFITLGVLSGRLSFVIVGMVAALGGRTLVYLVMLRSELRSQARKLFAALLRILTGTAAAAFVLATSGLGWQPVPSDTLAHRLHILAVWHLGIEGAVATGVYGLVLLALWLAWGRPDGPERAALGLLREFISADIIQRVSGFLPCARRAPEARVALPGTHLRSAHCAQTKEDVS